MYTILCHTILLDSRNASKNILIMTNTFLLKQQILNSTPDQDNFHYSATVPPVDFKQVQKGPSSLMGPFQNLLLYMYL